MKWSNRNELKVVRSVTGNTGCSDCNGRKAMNCPAAFVVPEGTGAPERINRGPIAPGRIGLIGGQTLPSLGEISGLVPVSPVVPPLEAKNAYARAPQIFAGTPLPTNVLMKAAWVGVMLVNVRAIGLRPGITGIVAEPVSPCATLLVKKPDSCRRRCSKATKKKVRFLSNGPPRVKPNCLRLNGGLATGAKGLRA